MKGFLTFLVVVGLAGGGFGYWYWHQNGSNGPAFRTVAVERGDLLATISATGTIEPEEVVDVGAQVAGMVREFGRDPRDSTKQIDWCSPVEVGTVLARIDDALYKAQVEAAAAQVEQAEAGHKQAVVQVDEAKANLTKAEAALGQMKAQLYQSNRDFARARQLQPAKAMADVDYDTAEATYRVNKANLAVGEASVAQAKASVDDAQTNVAVKKAMVSAAQATLRNAQVNLDYCTIKSPVKGVIVDRRVNVGQTVVASLSAPSLFLIAKDLKQLQIWASVNEADVGQIRPRQQVTFTVDAFPNQVFKGTVDQVRLNATMTNNVVTYTVVVNTTNSDGRLLPYMTANLQFEVNRRSKVLLVPNAALRWQPQPQEIAPEARAAFFKAKAKGKGGPGGSPTGKAAGEAHDRGTLWVADGAFVRPAPVRIGASDSSMTEILSGDVREGTDVVVGVARQEVAAGNTTNPFTPQLFNNNKKGPQ